MNTNQYEQNITIPYSGVKRLSPINLSVPLSDYRIAECPQQKESVYALPEMFPLAKYKDNQPALPDELIEGVLRCGHKMLISGCSKAGKSFLLMELSIAIAEGLEWVGFRCKKGRVLYINLEIDNASCIDRFMKIYDAMGIQKNHMEDIVVWNLRGHAAPLDKLVPEIIERIRDTHFDAVIFDPIYKIITGDENNATDMGRFCNQFDKICTETGCATIYCHHHSKGAQGSKKAMDRASGSGVFARDPDAQLDIIELSIPDNFQSNLPDPNITAWRMECSLREFKNFLPRNIWFCYPLHIIDTSGILDNAHISSGSNNLSMSSKRTSANERKELLDNAYDTLSANPPVKVQALAECMNVNEKTVRRYIEEFKCIYWCANSIVGKKSE